MVLLKKYIINQVQWLKKGKTILKLKTIEDNARLTILRSRAKLAQANYQRDIKQYKIKAISQSQFDSSKANRDISASQVIEQEAYISKKIIRAPFSGRLGIINAQVGQLLAVGAKNFLS